PYQQRTFPGNGNQPYYEGQGMTEFEELGRRLYPLQEGTVTKCNFCSERIEHGLGLGLTPGVDRDATPACVNICPTEARVFGDLEDSQSILSTLVKEKSGDPFHAEFGTKPSVFYLK
ncbi:MAG: 4Fe-4S ferredoxin, partial [bacterium]